MPRFFTRPRLLCFLAWALAVAVGVQRADRTWLGYDNQPFDPPDRWRADGNGGHAQIDFGGPWVLGRLVATGRGRQLYDRTAQWDVVREAYPRENESPWVRANAFPKDPNVVPNSPDDARHDAEWMMFWFMGQDSPRWADAGRVVAGSFAFQHPFSVAPLAGQEVPSDVVEDLSRKAVGGPLYPPVHGFLMAPFGAISHPQTAYRVMQVVLFLAVVLAALGMRRLSAGRIPWPVAIAFVLFFTGCLAGLQLAQNSALSLLFLVWGWVLLIRNRDVTGGMVWGLLVFKPLWGATFFLVPLMMGRWRFCAVMVLTGAGLAALTLPVVGVEVWKDWLAVGREAADLYNVNRNWVTLSRDLFGLPRRVLIDFGLPEADRHRLDATVAGWAIWLIVFAGTAAVFLRHPARRAPLGPAAGFALLGAYLCCYRFIYYDALVAAFPLAVLFAAPWRGLRVVPVGVVAALLALENVFVDRAFELTGTPLNTGVRWPWDTVLLLGLWGWLAVTLERERRAQATPLQPRSGGSR